MMTLRDTFHCLRTFVICLPATGEVEEVPHNHFVMMMMIIIYSTSVAGSRGPGRGRATDNQVNLDTRTPFTIRGGGGGAASMALIMHNVE